MQQESTDQARRVSKSNGSFQGIFAENPIRTFFEIGSGANSDLGRQTEKILDRPEICEEEWMNSDENFISLNSFN